MVKKKKTPKSSKKVIAVTGLITSSKYRKGLKKFENDQKVLDALEEVKIHIKTHGKKPLPSKFDDKPTTAQHERKQGWRNCKLTNKQSILKYRINDTDLELAAIGGHTEVHGN